MPKLIDSFIYFFESLESLLRLNTRRGKKITVFILLLTSIFILILAISKELRKIFIFYSVELIENIFRNQEVLFGIIISITSLVTAIRILIEFYEKENLSRHNNQILHEGYMEQEDIEKNKLQELAVKEKNKIEEYNELDLNHNMLAIEKTISANELITALEDKILSLLQERLDEKFLTIVQEKYGDTVRKTTAYGILKGEYEKARKRLNLEVISLNNRGKLNLSIGILISIIGIILLGWSLISAPVTISNNHDLVAYYIPRTAFVIMVQLFAFFFLNLYRASLNDIKYFQNEITNIESKILSIEILILSNDMESISRLASEIAKTERNFILSKGQTTIIL